MSENTTTAPVSNPRKPKPIHSTRDKISVARSEEEIATLLKAADAFNYASRATRRRIKEAADERIKVLRIIATKKNERNKN